ncbi:MAG: LacI family DNA-binding transcriptional regulator [Sphingomonadaceae bacterium]|nr:LacI family DNA-binding transcriptional regulator [Sphingomonadaceae bacterium]
MDDIARLAGVSKSTVSRALQGDARVKPATRERIVVLARKHGYAVNSNARKLRQNRVCNLNGVRNGYRREARCGTISATHAAQTGRLLLRADIQTG